MTLPLSIQSSIPSQTTLTLSGITPTEQALISTIIPKQYTLATTLTTSTSYVLVHTPTFTEKYICALQWNIPIVHVSFVYNTHVPIKSFIMTPFQNMKFTTEDVSSPVFKNYFICQGAVYVENMRIDVDFVIADGENERVQYAMRHGIPVIRTKDVFKNDYRLFLKKNQIFAIKDCDNGKEGSNDGTREYNENCKENSDGNDGKNDGDTKSDTNTKNNTKTGIFKDKVFYLDKQYLPKQLLQHLTRLIIQNGGCRISHGAQHAHYVIAQNGLSFEFIFQCVHYHALLHPAFFMNSNAVPVKVLEGCTFIVTTPYSDQVINKIRAMGGRTKQKYDYTVTHIVTQHDSLRKNAKCVRVGWIDRCLYAMRRCDERISIVRVPRTRSVTYNTHTMVQFTGIPPALKHTLKEQLNALDIKCADSEHMQGVTHLVSGSLATSEKFLCAMVSGVPIIKPNITCTDLDSLMWTEDDADDNDKKIVRAVMYWRGVIRRTHRLPFSGWRVRLLCTKARIGSYQRVLVCGGAEIVDEKWTHCFKSKDYDGENVKGVRTTDYIFSYLFSHTSKEK